MSATVAPEPTVYSVTPIVVDDIAHLPWESLTQQQQWDRCLVELQRRDYVNGKKGEEYSSKEDYILDVKYKRFLERKRLLKKDATEEEIEEERKKDDVFLSLIHI